MGILADGGWRMADGGWRMADGGWRMADGGWRMADGGTLLYEILDAPRGARFFSEGWSEVPPSGTSGALVTL
ncbi:MAG TPA: hypothetical protein VGL56_17060 [Fimbriimonadaceae bacterium]